ncbi:unnamed protein product [Spirodela intermedia]|uniref:Uncharacterized protein n=1 Tax=Spirodela intermedia TaxID=51605 RepID=A0ABN7EDA5_SPIIN|nr:unnamed protein product [Spirodela intermedia]
MAQESRRYRWDGMEGPRLRSLGSTPRGVGGGGGWRSRPRTSGAARAVPKTPWPFGELGGRGPPRLAGPPSARLLERE